MCRKSDDARDQSRSSIEKKSSTKPKQKKSRTSPNQLGAARDSLVSPEVQCIIIPPA